jgi:hypothetical protein
MHNGASKETPACWIRPPRMAAADCAQVDGMLGYKR